MKYSIPTYEKISIPREVLIYFVHQRKEYLLRTLYYLKHFASPQGYGSQFIFLDYSKNSINLGCSEQTLKNHVTKLVQYGFILPQKRKGFYYVPGHKQTLKVVRMYQDRTAFVIGLGKNPTKEKYIKRLHSVYAPAYRLSVKVWGLSKADFRTVVQGALYVKNIKQQIYRENIKYPQTFRGLINDKPGAESRGEISCFTAGEMLNRSLMSGQRLRKSLHNLGIIRLQPNSEYLGEYPLRAIEGIREAYEGKTVITTGSTTQGYRRAYLVFCSSSFLPIVPIPLISGYRLKLKSDILTVKKEIGENPREEKEALAESRGTLS